MKTCEKCLGTGTERTIVHGIERSGEACIEPIKCDSCDGFGTDRNMKPSELLELCMEFDAPDFAVFFSYSPHVKGITIDIHEHGWVSGQLPDYAHTHYLDRSFNGTTQDAANWLREIHEEFRSKQ